MLFSVPIYWLYFSIVSDSALQSHDWNLTKYPHKEHNQEQKKNYPISCIISGFNKSPLVLLLPLSFLLRYFILFPSGILSSVPDRGVNIYFKKEKKDLLIAPWS